MIACNHAVSSIAKQRGIPFVYRGHKLSDKYKSKVEYYDRIFRENPTSDNYETFTRMLKADYPTAFYTTDPNIGHQGLNLSDYCHITSPLRRFADCLNTMCLEDFYFCDRVDPNDSNYRSRLDEQCRYINDKKRTTDYFAKNYQKVIKKEK